MLGPETGIAVAPLQKAYERSSLSANEIAVGCGWMRRHNKHGKTYESGDGKRVLRALGLKRNTTHGKSRYETRGYITYDVAAKLCEAMGLDPVDYGL